MHAQQVLTADSAASWPTKATNVWIAYHYMGVDCMPLYGPSSNGYKFKLLL
jgi:hypothetical protein